MQKSMIEYIHTAMKGHHFPCEWRIEWFKQKNMIEVVIMIPAHANEDERIEDKYGNANIESFFVFEDAILLYDINLAEIQDDNYITAIKFDEPGGMYGGTMDALCKTLRIAVMQAMTRLEEFLKDEDQSVFFIEWNEENYQSTIQTLKNTGRFDKTLYYYPSDITEDVEGTDEME